MSTRIIAAIALSFALLAGPAGPVRAQTNLLINPSFESGFFTNVAFGFMPLAPGSTALTGWTIDTGTISWGITPNSTNIVASAGTNFLNLAGFHAAQHAVEAVSGSLTFNGAGCPVVPAAGAISAKTLRSLLTGVQPTDPDGLCAPSQADCFLHFNVMAIVVQVDKTLLLQNSDHLLSVWGSSHATPQ